MATPNAVRLPQRGFTLIESLVGITFVLIAIVSVLGAHVGQTALNEHARNLSLGMNDVSRVLEQIR